MKKVLFFPIVFLFFSLNINAQIVSPVKWEYKVNKITETSYELQAIATIDKPWHLYGQYFEDGGPIKLKFDFEENSNYELIGNTSEDPEPKTVKDEIFDIDVSYFTNKAIFTQKIKLKTITNIKLIIDGQICNDNTGMCIMVADEHIFRIK